VQFLQFLKVDLVPGTVARPLHLPEMSERTDRREHTRRDLHCELLRFELVEQGRARHAVQNVHLAVPGLQLDARRCGEIVSGQIILDRMPCPERRQYPGKPTQILRLRVGDEIDVSCGADDPMRSRCKTTDYDISDAAFIKSGDHRLGLKSGLGQLLRRP